MRRVTSATADEHDASRFLLRDELQHTSLCKMKRGDYWPETSEDIALIQHAVKTPIATVERIVWQHAFRDSMKKCAASAVQAELTYCGGFSEARRIAALYRLPPAAAC